MRSLLLAALAICGAGNVLAAELPISGPHGTPGACALYAVGGWEAVFDGQVKSGPQPDTPDDEQIILLEPHGLIAIEQSCSVRSVTGREATLACNAEGHASTWRIVVSPASGGYKVEVADSERTTFLVYPCAKPSS